MQGGVQGAGKGQAVGGTYHVEVSHRGFVLAPSPGFPAERDGRPGNEASSVPVGT